MLKKELYLKDIKIFSQNTNFELFEEQNSKSNYWLQTILLNKKYRKYKDQILEASNRDGIKMNLFGDQFINPNILKILIKWLKHFKIRE